MRDAERVVDLDLLRPIPLDLPSQVEHIVVRLLTLRRVEACGNSRRDGEIGLLVLDIWFLEYLGELGAQVGSRRRDGVLVDDPEILERKGQE